MNAPSFTKPVDVCLLLEGTYPFVAGGVSTWVHALLQAQPDLTFGLVCLTPDDRPLKRRYDVPANVRFVETIPLQSLPLGQHHAPFGSTDRVEGAVRALDAILRGTGEIAGLAAFAAQAARVRGFAGRRLLLDSRAAFRVVREAYERVGAQSSFLDFFWTWRSLASATLAVLLPALPPARCYHAVSTGFAGLLGARLAAETGRKLILTEHGIYTNERRIEIAMAEWLHRGPEASLAARKAERDLRDLWIDAFEGFGRLAYALADPIVTLYGGNQVMQLRDGADPARCTLIPNGIEPDRFAGIPRIPPANRPPTVALIGRVVPIKDIKTFIRAAAILRRDIPEIRAEILGPPDEDPDYAAECADLVRQLDLAETVTLHGAVSIADWLGRIDVNVLTSISEAQPLTILEAGAAGVPTVATDVGACREMIEGNLPGMSPLPAGGVISQVANPATTAHALAALLREPGAAAKAGQAMHARVRQRYLKSDCDRAYRDLYHRACAAPDTAEAA